MRTSGSTVQINFKLRIAPTLLALSAALASLTSLPGIAGNPIKTTDAPSLRSIAFEHYLCGDSEAALDYYQKAVDTASHDYGADSSYIAQLYYEMGTLALDAKKFVRADSYLQKAVQHNPNSIMARVKFAELLQLRGKHDEALQQIQAALARHNGSPEAREALVIWLQANKKMARAIRESYNLSVAARGAVVPLPVQMPKQPEPPTQLAAAVPVPPPVAVPIAPKAPLKLFPWMTEKKPEVKKPAETKTAPIKPVEVKKADKKPVKKEPKQAKPVVKEKPVKHTAKPPKPMQTQVAEMRAEQAALRTTAKALPKKKEPKKDEQAADPESGGSEARTEETAAAPAEPKPKKEPKLQMRAMAPAMQYIPVVKSSNRKQSMVPPPPPMVPVFPNPGMFQPPPVFRQPTPMKAAKPKPKEAAAAAPVKEPPPERPSSGGSSAAEEPDFILQWAGASGKKKGK